MKECPREICIVGIKSMHVAWDVDDIPFDVFLVMNAIPEFGIIPYTKFGTVQGVARGQMTELFRRPSSLGSGVRCIKKAMILTLTTPHDLVQSADVMSR